MIVLATQVQLMSILMEETKQSAHLLIIVELIITLLIVPGIEGLHKTKKVSPLEKIIKIDIGLHNTLT